MVNGFKMRTALIDDKKQNQLIKQFDKYGKKSPQQICFTFESLLLF